ncbi:MAG: TM0106 family RecB-like putative nuclease [Spirochaetia bacterium]
MSLRLSASVFYGLHRPSTCEKRVFLLAHEQPEGQPSELELAMRELGERHEKEHLSTFPQVRNLGDGSLSDRAQRTREAVESRTPVIYQGVLRSAFPGSRDIVTGIPDFMILGDDSYRIRDCKLSRSVRGDRHKEITHQLQTYGWLYEKTFKRPPASLEVYLGDRTLDTIPYAGPARAEAELGRVRDLSLLAAEPWEPVGWSKCSPCPFQDRCWKQAALSHDVSAVYGVDQGTARALRDLGISTWDQLLKEMGVERLAGLTRSRGNAEQKVGAGAARILAQAQALASGKIVRLATLILPDEPRVLLDLEGMPPQHDELERVYLWGMQVHGEAGRQAPYGPAVAGFGPEGDREGWERFLDNAAEVFRTHGRIPFVHWADYEKTKIRAYIDRYGDRAGVAARVLESCFDLLKAIRDSFALPVPSYGLKVIERLSGYRRSMKEYGGDWSISQYLRACESQDGQERARIMAEIARYNEEDLQAMGAILRWARGLAGTA